MRWLKIRAMEVEGVRYVQHPLGVGLVFLRLSSLHGCHVKRAS